MGQQESTDSHYVLLENNQSINNNNHEPFLKELQLVTQQALEAKQKARQCFIEEHLTKNPITQEQIISLITNLKNTLLEIAKDGYKCYDCNHPLVTRIRSQSQTHNCLKEHRIWANMIHSKLAQEFSLKTKMTYCSLDHCHLECDKNIHIDSEKLLIHITW